jgi:glycosyltransferase involved in cell wall biosynthesis
MIKIPKLSIGLPVYNGERFLPAAVDSLLKQDFTDFEMIISDNASTDGTAGICTEYARQDCRVRYLRADVNRGASPNYRTVFEHARGQYFKWAAHDDVHLPGFLTRCVQVLDQAPPSVVLVAPRTEVIDESGARLANDWKVECLDVRGSRPAQRVAEVLKNVEWATAQFGVFRADALRQTRLIDGFFAADYVLLLELALLGEIWEIPEVLFQRRFHDGISTNVNTTAEEFAKWFDPSRKGGRRLLPSIRLGLQPRWHLGVEFMKSIMRMPINSRDRLRCLLITSAIWSNKEAKRLSHEYFTTLRRQVCKVKV